MFSTCMILTLVVLSHLQNGILCYAHETAIEPKHLRNMTALLTLATAISPAH